MAKEEVLKDVKDIIEELTQYYEAAGFTNVYENKLKFMPEENLREVYKAIFDEKNNK